MTQTNTKPISPNLGVKEGAKTALIFLRFGFHANTPKGYLGSRSMSFDAQPDIEELAREQSVSPVTRFEDLLGGFWPEDESLEDFSAARERWRREGRDSST